MGDLLEAKAAEFADVDRPSYRAIRAKMLAESLQRFDTVVEAELAG